MHKLLNLVLVLQGKHEEAIRHYTAALALDKWRPEIWTSRGMAYYCVGEYESAVRDFTRYMAATQRGLLSELIQTDIFVRYLCNRCVRIEPSNPTPLFFRGRCFHKSGDLKAALVDFDAATEKARARILSMLCASAPAHMPRLLFLRFETTLTDGSLAGSGQH